MRRFLSLFIVGILSIFVFVGCSNEGKKDNDSSSKEKLPVIGVAIYKFDDNYMSYARTAIEAAGKDKAVIQMADSMNDQAKQNDQVDTFINKGVKALAINLVEPAAAETIVEKARSADIPVIFFNKEPDANVIKSYDKCWYVGITSQDIAVLQGEMITKKWKENSKWDKNGDGKIQYVLLKGEPGHPEAEIRAAVPMDTVEKNGIVTEQLELQTGMWDASKAKELMETWLASYSKGEIEMIVSNNDAMAMGAIEALKENGYYKDDKFIPVFGFDGIPEAVELIRSGHLAGTVLNDPKSFGKAVLTLTANAALGKDPIEGTEYKYGNIKDVRIPGVIIDETNLEIAEEAFRQ